MLQIMQLSFFSKTEINKPICYLLVFQIQKSISNDLFLLISNLLLINLLTFAGISIEFSRGFRTPMRTDIEQFSKLVLTLG